MTCPVAVECEHGFDVCPTCDPCTCDAESAPSSPIRPLRLSQLIERIRAITEGSPSVVKVGRDIVRRKAAVVPAARVTLESGKWFVVDLNEGRKAVAEHTLRTLLITRCREAKR